MPLRQDLENFIINKLEVYQGALGTDGVAGMLVDTFANASANPYPALAFANARLDDVTAKLNAELAAGTILPWVIPQVAAVAFEGVFESCVAFWIARGQPIPATSLKPDVTRFVKFQVRLFVVVGAPP